MLAEMPVRDEIREFLFKVWAEVLAVAAVKNGPQHEETLVLKKSASELVWAASAKPNRNERAQVIQELPKLLQRLRQGMTLIGIEGERAGSAHQDDRRHAGRCLPVQDRGHLACADRSHGQAAGPPGRLRGRRDPATDLPLDAQSIELMLGIDASMIEVVADGGSRPSAGMLAWADELQLGNWFALDHNGAVDPGPVRLAQRAQAAAPVRGARRPQLPDPGSPPGGLSAGRACWCRPKRKRSPCGPRAMRWPSWTRIPRDC